MKTLILAALMLGGASLSVQPVAAEDTQAENGEEASASGLRRMPDPDTIRCRRRPVIGSLYRRVRVCLTNRQWRELFRNGNRDANLVIDRGRLYAPPPG